MSDYVAFPIWFRYFLEEQGYKIKENIVYQDNQSKMKTEKNGMQSCGQKSRHIKSRYLFIKDRVKMNENKIIAKQRKCSRISSPSHYKANYSDDSEM